MKSGKMLEPGQVVLAQVQFADSFQAKKRPAVVLFEEFTNVVVAGITSNTKMKGISLPKKEGAIKDSVIKTNYIFTITEKAIAKKLFKLSNEKKNELYENLDKKLGKLKMPKR
ncbi:MAG: type II toxin-antitoxin system PemK/MazF family toxin [archaeon]|nr:type II toxin-antitoxin system PemK/MazF family toxin [archaeon]